MSRLTSIQGRIKTKIFDSFGSDIIREPFTSTTNDKWDSTRVYGSSTIIVGVPFNYVEFRESFNPFGVLGEGETDVMFAYDTTINKKDKITYQGVVYFVKSIEAYPFANGSLAQAVRLAKNI